MNLISEAGYVAVPNERVQDRLTDPGPALAGAVFFTLSLGAGLAVLAAGAGLAVGALPARRRETGWIAAAALHGAAFLTAVVTGPAPLFLVLIVLVPPPVFLLTLRRVRLHRGAGWEAVALAAPLIVLLSAWMLLSSENVFVDVRDYVLFSNPVGRAVTDFYYRYTLYPAEVFKPLAQKTMKTARLSDTADRYLDNRLRSLLVRSDYLPITTDRPVDLNVVIDDDRLRLRHLGRTVMEVDRETFFDRSREVLQDFSRRLDRSGPFRWSTFMSLLFLGPVCLYLLVFAGLQWLAGLVLPPAAAAALAGSIWIVAGMTMIVTIGVHQAEDLSLAQIQRRLASDRTADHVQALRAVRERDMILDHLGSYDHLMNSPSIPVRLNMALNLGRVHTDEAYRALLELADDPQINVAYSAVVGLGRQGRGGAVPELLERIEASDHWYYQLNAYQALRRLGWHQKWRPHQ
jgi:hypothetical protein